MKCVLCQVNEATVYFKQVTEGNSCEMNICESCAVKHGLLLNPPAKLADMIMGKDSKHSRQQSKGKVCPVCGLAESAFADKSRLGCSSCYETFKEDLSVLIGNVQKGERHCGKVPETAGVRGRIAQFESDLAMAVKKENFEDAAELRDRINELRKTSGIQ